MSEKQRPFVPKTPVDFQKLKLDRLMAHPDKPVIIPETPRDRKGFTVPEFVRNVMGSSAGAGSGEFHVYRHLRRKEYTRQKMIDERAEQERLDAEFERKLEENKRKMEEKTAKKRAKRLKRKEKRKQQPNVSKKAKISVNEENESSSESENNESPDEPSESEQNSEQSLTTDSKQDTGNNDSDDKADVTDLTEISLE